MSKLYRKQYGFDMANGRAVVVRKVLCRLGVHSWFEQHDRWGTACVCRYCVAVHSIGGRGNGGDGA